MRDMAYHSNVMTIIAKHPRRNIYCVLLSFHRRFLKLNLSENMGSSLIIKISVTRDTTMINIGNRLELKKGSIGCKVDESVLAKSYTHP